ncbi:MAG TPA: hypothetical protein VM925_03550, partial [Labilithrix sp.]|nr:hypothetical protein [Labilithrix sp.]
MSEHPPSFRLDAHAAGDHDARVTEHLESCERCALYIAEAIETARAFRAKEGADGEAFLASLQKRE